MKIGEILLWTMIVIVGVPSVALAIHDLWYWLTNDD